MNFVKTILEKIFGDPSERELEKMQEVVEKISIYEPEFEKMSDANLRAKTQEAFAIERLSELACRRVVDPSAKQRFPVCAVQAQAGNLNDRGEQPSPASAPE